MTLLHDFYNLTLSYLENTPASPRDATSHFLHAGSSSSCRLAVSLEGCTETRQLPAEKPVLKITEGRKVNHALPVPGIFFSPIFRTIPKQTKAQPKETHR